MSYARRPLSGSTHGRPIKLAATATPGTLLHTGQASATLVDVASIFLCNTSTTNVQVTLEWGGVTAPDDNLIFDVPAKATICAVPDGVIRNSLVIRGFASVANVVIASGFVNTES